MEASIQQLAPWEMGSKQIHPAMRDGGGKRKPGAGDDADISSAPGGVHVTRQAFNGDG